MIRLKPAINNGLAYPSIAGLLLGSIAGANGVTVAIAVGLFACPIRYFIKSEQSKIWKKVSVTALVTASAIFTSAMGGTITSGIFHKTIAPEMTKEETREKQLAAHKQKWIGYEKHAAKISKKNKELIEFYENHNTITNYELIAQHEDIKYVRDNATNHAYIVEKGRRFAIRSHGYNQVTRKAVLTHVDSSEFQRAGKYRNHNYLITNDNNIYKVNYDWTIPQYPQNCDGRKMLNNCDAISKYFGVKRDPAKQLPQADLQYARKHLDNVVDSCTLGKDPNQTARQRKNSKIMCECMYIAKVANPNMSDQQIVIDCVNVVRLSQ